MEGLATVLKSPFQNLDSQPTQFVSYYGMYLDNLLEAIVMVSIFSMSVRVCGMIKHAVILVLSCSFALPVVWPHPWGTDLVNCTLSLETLRHM